MNQINKKIVAGVTQKSLKEQVLDEIATCYWLDLPKLLQSLPLELQSNRDIILSAAKNGLSYAKIKNTSFKIDKDICLACINSNYNTYQYLPKELQVQEVFAVAFVRAGGLFQILSDELRNNRTVVWNAVNKFAHNLKYIGETLVGDKEIEFTAVKNHPSSIFYTCPKTNHFRDLVKLAASKGYVIGTGYEIKKRYKYDDSVIRILEEIVNDEEIASIAVWARGENLRYFDRDDVDLVTAAVKESGHSLQHAVSRYNGQLMCPSDVKKELIMRYAIATGDNINYVLKLIKKKLGIKSSEIRGKLDSKIQCLSASLRKLQILVSKDPTFYATVKPLLHGFLGSDLANKASLPFLNFKKELDRYLNAMPLSIFLVFLSGSKSVAPGVGDMVGEAVVVDDQIGARKSVCSIKKLDFNGRYFAILCKKNIAEYLGVINLIQLQKEYDINEEKLLAMLAACKRLIQCVEEFGIENSLSEIVDALALFEAYRKIKDQK